MARKDWKHLRARSIPHAMELCVEYARSKQNRSVEHLAELMGEASHNTLYKWLATGRMPAIKVRAFEMACGIDYVSQYLAHSANKLIVEMPTGRKAEHRQLNELSSYSNKVIAMLIDFYEDRSEQEEVLDAITVLIEDLAHQRGNIERYQQPELL
ncbi:hypothetical protein Q4508_12430 [Amphritea sp. 2_MG-2023]|uniref:hypothetical protein n=1 Tax=Amphritea TaxID=515417 RepID=UPI001C07B031|nr:MULTISPECIES: hypothetical protein [Amphritea]MBU2967089.1 hypothetical protein [Amphritea atlantica]MDO6419358.1 hypothetical protein [Amphritea sp. 2_MG-2023]